MTDLRKLWYPAIGAGVAFLVCSAWLVGRQLYWHAGRGRKVGISCENYKAPIDEWVETRKEIALLCESVPPEQKIHLKLLPPDFTNSEKRLARTKKRYGIPMVFRVTVSNKVGKTDEPITQIEYQVEFGAALHEEFIQALEHGAKAMCSSSPVHSTKDLFKVHAGRMFDVILLYLAVVDFTHNKHETAAKFLQKLDERIAPRVPLDQHPRPLICWMRARCLTVGSSYPGNHPPEADDLLAVIRVSRMAADTYGPQFPFLYNIVARDLFYLRDLAEALAYTEKALAAKNIHPHQRASAFLNKGVLNLFLDRYSEAEVGFSEFFKSGWANQFSWNDLTNFADFAYDFDYMSAIFMRVLYRKVSGAHVPADMAARLAKWIKGDPARNILGVLYHTQQPLVAKPQSATQTQSSSKVSGRAKKSTKRRR